MSETITISCATQAVLDLLLIQSTIRPYLNRMTFRYRDYNANSSISLDLLRKKLLSIEEVISTTELGNEPLFIGETISDWLWLLYEEDDDIIPIYDDGIATTRWKPLIQPSAIPNIISLLVVNKAIGVDIENHGFGYHFHFGEIRRNKLIRSNVLFSFDPDSETRTPQKHALFAENHGAGLKKDISTIGNNKRRPIYDVCASEMSKRGLANFRKPSMTASVFYPV